MEESEEEMTEYLQILTVTLSASLWALGGTCWKPWRRYVLPAILCAITLYSGVEPWKSGLMAVLLAGTASMGYGDGRTWLQRFCVGCTYSIATLPLGFTVWQIITPIVFISTFWLSKREAEGFTWKICELLTGAMIGVTIAALIST